MKDYEAAWSYLLADMIDALERFDREEDGLPHESVKAITGTLEGVLEKMHLMECCTDEEIQLMIEEHSSNKKESEDGSYH